MRFRKAILFIYSSPYHFLEYQISCSFLLTRLVFKLFFFKTDYIFFEYLFNEWMLNCIYFKSRLTVKSFTSICLFITLFPYSVSMKTLYIFIILHFSDKICKKRYKMADIRQHCLILFSFRMCLKSIPYSLIWILEFDIKVLSILKKNWLK